MIWRKNHWIALKNKHWIAYLIFVDPTLAQVGVNVDAKEVEDVDTEEKEETFERDPEKPYWEV